MKKHNNRDLISKIILIFFFIFVSIIVIFPIYFVISTSLKDYAEYIRNPIGLDLSNVSLDNYKEENFNRFVNDVVLLCNDNSTTKSKFKNVAIFGLFYRKNYGIKIDIDNTIFTFADFIGESLYIDAMNILNKINN